MTERNGTLVASVSPIFMNIEGCCHAQMQSSSYYLIAAVFGIGALIEGASAAKWKFNNGLPESRNEFRQLDVFAAEVSEPSNGSLTINIFRGGSPTLKNEGVVRWLPRGAVEIGLV